MLFIVAALVAFLIAAIGCATLDVIKAAGERPAPITFTPYTGPRYTRHGREIVPAGRMVL